MRIAGRFIYGEVFQTGSPAVFHECQTGGWKIVHHREIAVDISLQELLVCCSTTGELIFMELVKEARRNGKTMKRRLTGDGE